MNEKQRVGAWMVVASVVLAAVVVAGGHDAWVWGTTFAPSVLAPVLLVAGLATVCRGRERDGIDR